MGSVVVWDLLANVEDCPKIDGLITFGSPLALDFVQRGLKKANGSSFSQDYPAKLKGNWHNLVARFDLAVQFDTDFQREFGGGSGARSIKSHPINNPDLIRGQGPWQLVSSAHSLTGYLRHSAVGGALVDLGLPAGGLSNQEAARPGGRRESRSQIRVAELAARRFRDSKSRRDEIESVRRGLPSLIEFESRERVINKLSLLDVPGDLARDLVAGAVRDPLQSVQLERILGEADFLASSFALKAAALTSAVGKIVVEYPGQGTWYGTGFLISDQLMMTNNHVLPSPKAASEAQLLLDYSLSSEEEERRATKVRLRPDLFFITSKEDALDYTIVALDLANGALNRPWFQLIADSGKALLGDHINIIQHPDGRRQELVVRNSRVTFVDDEKAYVYYQADTEGGSSGSPVCNDRWQLAFLHHASVPVRDDEGFVLKKNGQRYRRGDPDSDVNWISNEGIRISRVISDARSKLLSTLQSSMFDACFEDPDLTEFVKIAPNTISMGNQPMRPNEGSSGYQHSPHSRGQHPLRHHSDGSSSWLFELSFGPLGAPQSDLVTPDAAPQQVTMPTRVALQTPLTVTSSHPGPTDIELRDVAARLIERATIEEIYYDEEKDAASKEAYYGDIAESGGEVQLYKEYRDLVRLTHEEEFSYSKARLSVLYPYADRHEDGSLRSVYSGEIVDAQEIIAHELASILRDADLPQLGREMMLEGDWLDTILSAADGLGINERTDPFNCEHVVPQSWFSKRQPMKADLHHLFTCEPRCNSFRNNFAYGEFDNYEGGQLDPEEASLRKLCGFRDLVGGSTSFEPERNKGAVARATLYFLLRYPGEVGDADNEYSKDDLELLKQWHEDEPPALWELHRNRSIFLNQGNRNPLIDRPHLAERIAFHKGLDR